MANNASDSHSGGSPFEYRLLTERVLEKEESFSHERDEILEDWGQISYWWKFIIYIFHLILFG
jgi:hypothetical protein